MKILINFILLSVFSFASILDFHYLDSAKEAYEKKEYNKAQELYGKVDNDEARFNRADALYRQQKYKEALEEYQAIKDKSLEFKKLHNIGNCYANLKKIDEAIKSYEEALKIKEDKDTRFNLELLKKKKKEQQQKKKQDQKKNQDKKDKKDKQKEQNKNQQQQNKQNQKDKNQQNKDKKEQKQNQQQQQNKQNQNQKDKQKEQNKDKKEEAKKEKEAQQKKEEQKKKEQQQKAQMAKIKKQPPITDMEERKWQKMLNQKGVNTLMLPLSNNKERKRDETNPW